MRIIQKILIIFIVFLVSGCSELRVGEKELRLEYLREIPIGTNYKEVNKKLLDTISVNDISYHENSECLINGKRTKAKFILVYMGWYFDVIMPVDTHSKWCFYENDLLVELIVI